MKTLFVTNGLPTDKNPDYCIFNKEQINKLSNSVDVCVIFINAREHGRAEYLKALPLIRRESKNCDIIHCFHGLSFLTAALVTRKPIVVSFLNDLDNEYRELGRLARNILQWLTIFLVRLRHAVVIFKSQPERDCLPNVDWHVIPNGVETTFFFPSDRNDARVELGLEPDARYVLFVSSKEPNRKQKRIDRFKRIMTQLKNRPEYADVQPLLMSAVARGSVPKYFNASDVLLLTSDFEGSPNAVKEALACDIPVVATRVGDIQFLLGDSENCAHAEREDEEGLLESLCDTLDRDYERTGELRKRIEQLGLTAEAQAQKIVGLYKDQLR